jgi:hypothetical protein
MDDDQVLRKIASSVITTMHQIPQINQLPIQELHHIPLGFLRRDATRLHAVCRYRKGIAKSQISGPSDVRCVDVHPAALKEEWRLYAAFLLYHEFLHALGFTGHDRTFRRLEALWPNTTATKMGPSFGQHLRRLRSKWLWRCPQCAKEHPRNRRGNGRYRCRECRTVLIDVRAEAAGPNA